MGDVWVTSSYHSPSRLTRTTGSSGLSSEADTDASVGMNSPPPIPGRTEMSPCRCVVSTLFLTNTHPNIPYANTPIRGFVSFCLRQHAKF